MSFYILINLTGEGIIHRVSHPLILSLESTLGYFEVRVANSNNDILKDLISALKKQIQLLS